MKRSTIFLIVLMSALVVAPIIYIGLVAKDIMNIKDRITEELDINFSDGEKLSYKMRVTSSEASIIDNCYINISTYDGPVVDTLQSVIFALPAVDGVTAELRNDSIIIVLDNTDASLYDGLCIAVQLPAESQLKIENNVPTADIGFNDSRLSVLQVGSLSDLYFDDCNIGVFTASDVTTVKEYRLEDTNIGAMEVNGDNVDLLIADCRVGGMTIAGTCHSIHFSDSDIGVCSWNSACNDMAVIDDCHIATRAEENALNVKVNDNSSNGKNGKPSAGDDGDQVEISLSGVKVKSDDGTLVEITPSAVVVESDESAVNISPVGIVVKDGDKDVVKIGVQGAEVSN